MALGAAAELRFQLLLGSLFRLVTNDVTQKIAPVTVLL
jgi:hypothetical protein